MQRTSLIIRGGLAVAVVGVAAAAVVAVRRDDNTNTSHASPLTTATVEQGDLSSTLSIDGSVEFADVTTVLHRALTTTSSSRPGPGGGATTATAATQMVTSTLGVGTPVTNGSVLYSVESNPVVALTGALPAWRTMAVGVADGLDVAQLEAALTALGYDPDATMTVDDHFDSRTRAIVRAWQAGYGLTVTGSVTLGTVVFLPADTSVAQVDVAVGDAVADGDQVLTLTGTAQEVVIEVPTEDQALFAPGLNVTVGDTTGVVQLLRSAERDGSVVVEAVIVPATPLEGAGNGATVSVSAKLVQLTGALLVPTEALVSRLDGSYALQVVGDGGSVTFVAVDVLGTAGSRAAVSGTGIEVGTQVMQPA
ncbi:MAG TPA: peptidoglycan-binding protein [Ilumatobacteraceae bacterium]|nr:peptidoglycan-binding protein [Ilumatobacteraceae bacterium]